MAQAANKIERTQTLKCVYIEAFILPGKPRVLETLFEGRALRVIWCDNSE